jgi:hypothetical protein
MPLAKVPCTRTTGRGCWAEGWQEKSFQPLLGAESAESAEAAAVGATAIAAASEHAARSRFQGSFM